ncbi:MAG TPA: hypothetical protein VL860_11140 [Planctomycetota bacterium]|nr:hypothetical protein [Planctomycetota bacterium]
MPPASTLRRFPRLELPTSPVTRDFLKNFDHAGLAAWIGVLEHHGVRPLLLLRAGDYTKAALDLRHLCSQHRDRAGRHRLALLLDDFAADDAANISAATASAGAGAAMASCATLGQAGIRLGDHQPVWLLARGLPGCARHEQGRTPDELPAASVERAEALYHLAVGELGTERILFGSGLNLSDPDRIRRQNALAAWFQAPRPWLDADSVELIFGANQRRLLGPALTDSDSSGSGP